MFRKLCLSLVSILSLSNFAYSSFPANTLVKTEFGYKEICQIEVGDLVESLSSGEIVFSKVIYKRSIVEKGFIVIKLANETIVVSRDQRFYLPYQKKWQKVELLKPKDVFLKNAGQYAEIEEIHFDDNSIELFDISVEKTHNYFVSKDNILAHNFVPFFIAATFLFGGGAIEFASFSAGVGLVAAGIGAVALSLNQKKNKSKPDFNLEVTPSGCSPGGSPNNNEDASKDKKRTYYDVIADCRTLSNDGKGERRAELLKDIIDGSKLSEKQGTKVTQYEMPGDFNIGMKYFNDLKLSDIKNVSENGKSITIGFLPDGTKVTIRDYSDFGSPTLDFALGKYNILKFRLI